MKKFFSIKSESYEFEIWDLTAILTVLNVMLIVLGFQWAPILGLINCAISLVMALKNHLHINTYLTQLSLVVLNIYFLSFWK